MSWQYDHTHFKCSDQDKTANFFKENFGAKEVSRWEVNGMPIVTLEIGGCLYNFSPKRANETVDTSMGTVRLRRVPHCLKTNDLDAEAAKMKARGVKFTQDVKPAQSQDQVRLHRGAGRHLHRVAAAGLGDSRRPSAVSRRARSPTECLAARSRIRGRVVVRSESMSRAKRESRREPAGADGHPPARRRPGSTRSWRSSGDTYPDARCELTLLARRWNSWSRRSFRPSVPTLA